MPGLAASQITLKDYPSLANPLTLDVDPVQYDVFNVPIRGSATKVLDGTVVRQYFSVNKRDYVINLQGFITDISTLQALWSRYRDGGTGKLYQLDDWYSNRLVVAFAPGSESFHPQYLTGAINAHSYNLSFIVCDILLMFGNAY